MSDGPGGAEGVGDGSDGPAALLPQLGHGLGGQFLLAAEVVTAAGHVQQQAIGRLGEIDGDARAKALAPERQLAERGAVGLGIVRLEASRGRREQRLRLGQ